MKKEKYITRLQLTEREKTFTMALMAENIERIDQTPQA